MQLRVHCHLIHLRKHVHQLALTHRHCRRNFQGLKSTFYGFFYRFDRHFFFRSYQSNRYTFFIYPTRTATAMCIGFFIVRQHIVNNMSQIVHIQSTCCHISRHQNLQVFDSEFVHHSIALCLRQIAMQCIGIVTVYHQFFCHLFGFHTGTTKHNAINIRIVIQYTLKHLITYRIFSKDKVMFYILSRLTTLTNGYFLRILHVITSNIGYFLRHSGREQQGTPRRWSMF